MDMKRMRYLLSKKITAAVLSVKRYTVYFSLMFIAVNPVSDNDKDVRLSLQKNQSNTSEDSSASTAQKVADYYKLGKLYQLQGDIDSSYNAFLMGESLEDGGAFLLSQPMSQSLSSPSILMDSSLTPAPNAVRNNSLNDYLSSLVSLYVQRAHMLMKNNENLSEAQNELEKILIIDPTNREAKNLQKEIGLARKNSEPREVAINDVRPQRDVVITKPITRTNVTSKLNERDVRVEKVVVEKKESKPAVQAVHAESSLNSDVIESALNQAEYKVSQSLLTAPEYEAEELKIKKHYDQGKAYYVQGDYFLSVNEFKKVLAINPHHLYAGYARSYIERGMKAIKEKEEMDLRTGLGGALATTDSEIVERDQEPMNEALLLVPQSKDENIQSVHAEALPLEKEIANSLAAIATYIEDKEYVKANEAINVLLDLDKDNAEARAMRSKVRALIEEETRLSHELIRLRCVADEEASRRKYSDRQKWRHARRMQLEDRYRKANEINKTVAIQSMQKITSEKVSEIEKRIALKDYIKADTVLKHIFILDPEHSRAREFEKTIQTEIKELANLLKEKPEPLEVDDFEKEEKHFTQKRPTELRARTREHVEISLSEKEKKAILDTDVPSHVHDAIKNTHTASVNPSLFGSISHYKPFTVMTAQNASLSTATKHDAQINMKEVQKSTSAQRVQNAVLPKVEREVRIVKVEPRKKDVKVQPARNVTIAVTDTKEAQNAKSDALVQNNADSASPEFNQDKRDTINQWLGLKSDGSVPSDQVEDNKLLRYLDRGKQHLQQKNYPLALVSFNKVLSLDSGKKYSAEVESLIQQTRQYLYD
jgi:tetratricopeptide (TPR) repeat protein